MTGKRRQPPAPLREVLEKFFVRAGLKSRLADQRILDVWEKAVGRGIAEQTQPLRVQNGILWVGVSHPVWMQQLHFMKEGILKRIREETEAPGLADLRWILGEIKERASQETRKGCQSGPPSGPSLPLTESEKERIRAATAELGDPEMREIFERVFSLGLSAKRGGLSGGNKEEE